MAASTPHTEQRQSTLPRRVNISSKITTPLHKESPRDTTTTVKIIAKDYNLWFDGQDVVKKVENIAETEGKSGRDIEIKITFWTKDEEISHYIEVMPEYGTADWDKLKVDMKRRWGTVSPERRYRLSSITELITKPQQ
ncbi:hypothetical protein O181_084017 [Austropuccinia psidii MF-1]|uniref:Uncharacterized protein n=1 Tax=Austropuccinia psidii MF-1 TaxID=1389203 RepID=A0A9Q3IKL5_9BASI|nr:hypothetical protein [Austropuccinia psidii MF-1]